MNPRSYRRAFRTFRLAGLVARRVAIKSFNDNIFGASAQMGFYFLLSLFPFLLLLMTLLPYITEPSLVENLMPMLRRVVPSEAMGWVRANLQKVLTDRREGLLSVSAFVLLWSASSGVGAIIDGLNVAYRVKESRPIWRARLVALLLTVILGGFIMVSIIMLVFGSMLNELAASYLPASVILWAVARWFLALLLLVLALDIIYFISPNVKHRWRWFSPGALVAAPLWVGISLGLRWYIGRFGRYEATYGTLAAVISMMLWFYFSGLALLAGGEVNSVMEREVLREAKPAGPPAPAPAAAHQ